MTHTLQAIAWTLIHFCWQAAAIALVYKLADLAMARTVRRRVTSSRLRRCWAC